MLTDAERRAQAWHDEQVATDPEHEQWSSCWCCCITCQPDSGAGNPHWSEAAGLPEESTDGEGRRS